MSLVIVMILHFVSSSPVLPAASIYIPTMPWYMENKKSIGGDTAKLQATEHGIDPHSLPIGEGVCEVATFP